MKLEPKEHIIRHRNTLGYGLILSAALSLGCWGSLLSMFRLPLPFPAVLGLVICLPPVFVLLGSIRGIGRFMAFYVLLLTAVWILLCYQDMADGFLQILNQAIRSLNAAWGTGYLDYQSSGTVSHLWMAFLAVAVVVSAAIGQSIAQRQPLPGFLFTAALVLAGLALKEQPSVWMLILLTLAWAALFLLCSGAGRLPVIAVSLICLCVLSLFFTRSSWQPKDCLDAARQRFVSWEEQLRYGGTKIDSLSEGDLTKTHPLKYDDRAVFTLQMQLGQSLYLRGFTGASYANQKWSRAEQTAYGGKYRGLMQWLEENGYEPWCQENSIYRLLPDYTFTEVKVKNQRASSKYLWMPYETAVSGDAKNGTAKYDQDQTPRTSGFRGQREYTLHIFDSRLKEYSDAAGAQMLRSMEKQDGYEAYLTKEKLYRTFVYDRYLDVDRETAAVLNHLPVEQCRGKTLDYCLYVLRNRFTKNYTYDINTKAAPEGQDALQWFLTRSKKGNSMHFATAAALFLREAGFPTRYAEGYYLSPSQLKLYEELENVKMPVADSASHAWVEVYVDRVGWMPVEVTPGFYDMKKRQSRQKEKTEKLTSTRQETYPDELQVDDTPSQSPLKETPLYWPWILAGVLVFLVLSVLLRRMRLRRPRDVAGMYRYLSKVLAFDGIRIREDPYRPLKKVAARYDAVTPEMTYEQALRLLYQDRYSEDRLQEQQIRSLDQYSREVAGAVYARQRLWRKCWMRLGRILW